MFIKINLNTCDFYAINYELKNNTHLTIYACINNYIVIFSINQILNYT